MVFPGRGHSQTIDLANLSFNIHGVPHVVKHTVSKSIASFCPCILLIFSFSRDSVVLKQKYLDAIKKNYASQAQSLDFMKMEDAVKVSQGIDLSLFIS